MLTTSLLTTLLLNLTPAPPMDEATSASLLNDPSRSYAVSLSAELGFLGVASHTIQLGRSGTQFNYVARGGQDNLAPVARVSAELALWGRHRAVLLYQPLDLRTSEVLRKPLVVDDLTFPAGTPMDFRYGFSFWRASYLYDFIDATDVELSLGLSLQIRNAAIEFQSTDGTLSRVNHDIGPVPILKVRARAPLGQLAWVAGEADGFYAPIKYLNGGSSDVEGAILDAAVRLGTRLRWGIEPFVNVRYLGGGASGTSPDKGFGDGYVNNWLHFVIVSLGVNLT